MLHSRGFQEHGQVANVAWDFGPFLAPSQFSKASSTHMRVCAVALLGSKSIEENFPFPDIASMDVSSTRLHQTEPEAR
jgi:hypothetical protein